MIRHKVPHRGRSLMTYEKGVIWTLYRFVYIEERVLQVKELPKGFHHLPDFRGPFSSVTMTDLGIVNDDELFDKLRYFKRGVAPELQSRIMVSGYPDARPMLSLPDWCKACGIE